MTPVRYGIELEGPHKGLRTLVLLTVRQHRLEFVRDTLAKHSREADHVWVQCQPDERYDWPAVHEIRRAGFLVTAQVRDAADLPPKDMGRSVSLVWLIPAKYAQVAAVCTHATYFTPGGGSFAGHETRLAFRPFDEVNYESDEVWT